MNRGTLTTLLALSLLSPAVARQPDAPATPEQRIAQLEAEVAKLRQERDELRVRMGEAIELLRNLGYAPPAPLLAEPSDPMASPIATMQTLRRRARVDLATMPRQTLGDREAYRQAAQSWVEKMNSGLGGEKDWLVRVLRVDLPSISSSAARATAVLQLFDAATGAPLSLPMEVSVPGRVGRRMAEGGVNQGWMARVNLKPGVRYNPDRLERGPFDHPPFLAPEVEAVTAVDWLRFEPTAVPEGFFPAAPGEDPLAVLEAPPVRDSAPDTESASQPR